MKHKDVKIGVIGGTGVYDIAGLEIIDQVKVETSWGNPSDDIVIARFQDTKIAFLPRHGRGHFIQPSDIPQKANLAALKMLGVKEIIAFSAVGSLKEEIAPLHFAIPDQIIDRTRHRPYTYYNEGIVVHVSFGNPFTKELADIAIRAIKKTDIVYHTQETLVCMEGPAFSTRAESKLYKSWGAGLINMSAVPEAKLARELEIPYQMICMATDYDAWRESEEVVTSEEVMSVVFKNSDNAKKLLKEMLPDLIAFDSSNTEAASAVRHSILTAKEKRRPEIVAKYETVLPGIFR